MLSFAVAHRATAVVATGYAIALAAANFALAVLLYRNAEEAGVALSAAGCAYFAGTVALLRTAGAALGPPVTLRALLPVARGARGGLQPPSRSRRRIKIAYSRMAG